MLNPEKLLNTLFEDKGHYVTVADKKYSVYFGSDV